MAYNWGASGSATGAGTRSAREGFTIDSFYLRDENGQYVAQALHGVKRTGTWTVVDSGATYTPGQTIGNCKVVSANKVYSNTDWVVWEITGETFDSDPA